MEKAPHILLPLEENKEDLRSSFVSTRVCWYMKKLHESKIIPELPKEIIEIMGKPPILLPLEENRVEVIDSLPSLHYILQKLQESKIIPELVPNLTILPSLKTRTALADKTNFDCILDLTDLTAHQIAEGVDRLLNFSTTIKMCCMYPWKSDPTYFTKYGTFSVKV